MKVGLFIILFSFFFFLIALYKIQKGWILQVELVQRKNEQHTRAQHSPAKGTGKKHTDTYFFWIKEGIKLASNINSKIFTTLEFLLKISFHIKGMYFWSEKTFY